jgi:hypothetical protein
LLRDATCSVTGRRGTPHSRSTPNLPAHWPPTPFFTPGRARRALAFSRPRGGGSR